MFMTMEEVRRIGFRQIGQCILIDRAAIIIRPEQVSLGDHVRIDAFCIISAGDKGVVIGNYVHLGAGAMLYGGGGKVELEDFSNISSRVSIFSLSDDYSGESLTNPLIPEELKNLQKGAVVVKRHAIIGCGSVVMPGVRIGTGAGVGALSYVNRDIPDFTIGVGSPVRFIGKRSKRLLDLEKRLMDRSASSRRKLHAVC